MSNEENMIDSSAKGFFQMVDDIFEPDEFKEICKGFLKYDDIDKRNLIFGVCELILASKEIGYTNPLLSGIQLILISSIIEMLTNRKEYIRFDDWYNLNKNMVKDWKCLRAWWKYNSEYGAAKNFRKFFLNLSDSEKISLLTKLKKKYADKVLAPFCYQSRDECFYRLHSSIRDEKNISEIYHYDYNCKGINGPQECPALINQKILNNGIKKFADHLYQLRSNFVHESRLPDFSYPPPSYAEKGILIETIYSYSIKVPRKKRKDKKYERERLIGILSPKDLYDIMKKYLPNLFIKYLKEVKY